MNKKKQDFLKKIKTWEEKNELVLERYGVTDFTELVYGSFSVLDTILDTGFRKIEEFGGEGKGDEYWIVIQDIESGDYFKIDLYYSSYNGVDLSDAEWEPVTPKEKTITVYE